MVENQLTRYGSIAKMLPFSVGKIFFVIKSSETYYKDFQYTFPADRDGVERVYSTVEAAYAAIVSNRNDVVVLDNNSGHAVSAMLDTSNSRTHFIGMDYLLGNKRHFGSRSRITIGVTTVATDIAVMKNTGVGNSFKGIKFDSSNTKAESIYSVAEGGEYAYYENCEFYKSTDLDVSLSAELLLNGDSPKFVGCTFGSLANASTGTTIRPNVLLSRETLTGKVCRDAYFEDCLFWKNSAHTTSAFIYAPGATDVERMLTLKGCGFINAILSAAVPAQAISATTQTQGYIILDPTCFAVNVTKLSTSTGVIVTAPAPNSGAYIGVNSA